MTKIIENREPDNSKRTKRYEKDWKLELSALIGFCVSGAIFILSGIKNGDLLTIAGSVVWIISCLTWMIPYRKYFDTSEHTQDCGYQITKQRNPDK